MQIKQFITITITTTTTTTTTTTNTVKGYYVSLLYKVIVVL